MMTTRKKIRFNASIDPSKKVEIEYLAHEDEEGQTWKPLTQEQFARITFGEVGDPVPAKGVKIHSLEKIMTHTNLFEETLEILSTYGKTPEDIEWIGQIALPDLSDHIDHISWETFEIEASRYEYEKRIRFEKIPEGLIIAGNDWWLEREDDDGLHSWKFKRKPRKPVRALGEFRLPNPYNF